MLARRLGVELSVAARTYAPSRQHATGQRSQNGRNSSVPSHPPISPTASVLSGVATMTCHQLSRRSGAPWASMGPFARPAALVVGTGVP